jgi:hypothetical protein
VVGIHRDGRLAASRDRKQPLMSATIALPSRTKVGSPLSSAGHPLRVTRGHALPLGANLTPSGVNFALICRHATAIRLVLSEPHDPGILSEIALDPGTNRTGDHWHIRVDGLPEEFCYGYRVDGPSGNHPGLRGGSGPSRSGSD